MVAALLLAGCASSGRPPTELASTTPDAVATLVGACAPPAVRAADVAWCELPADVRAFIDDRDSCDHFRSEPWPETDSTDDRDRRRALIEGVRMNCGGTDARLAELRQRYAADSQVIAVLAEFEARVE